MHYYYIGLNANNAIENDCFFDGSITIYPTSEKGNIFFSDKHLVDTSSAQFMNQYKQFVEQTVAAILSKEKALFFCFNSKVKEMCQNIGWIPIAKNNREELLTNINNKFKIREQFQNKIPILDYMYIKEGIDDYKYLCNELNTDKIVLQERTGAGGETTFLIDSETVLGNIVNLENEYSISKYEENIPLNATIIIGNEDIIYLPKSIQLIKIINQKFKYVGGDFFYIEYLQDSIINKVDKYCKIICEQLKKEGYRGVLGIDFIVTKNGDVFFMEINPRFQSSTFMINLFLKKYENCDVAKLNYDALIGNRLPPIQLQNIEYSFLNCNLERNFDSIENFSTIKKGYFVENESSIYRKVYKKTILYEDSFERIN